MCTSLISSNGTYNVSKIGYCGTKLEVTMFKITMYNAHIGSNGSQFLQLGFWCTVHIRSVNLGVVGQS